jgi:2-phosphoglycerate kinase
MQVFYITELIDTISLSYSTAYSFFSSLTRQNHVLAQGFELQSHSISVAVAAVITSGRDCQL